MSKLSSVDQMSRLLSVVRMISRPEGATLMEISRKTGVDRWTTKKVIDDLENMNGEGYGLEITEENDPSDRRKTRYFIAKDCLWTLTLPGIPLNDDEAFYLSLMLSCGKGNEELEKTTQSIKKKLDLFKNIRTYEVLNVSTIKKTTKDETQKVMLTILDAVNKGKCLRFDYKPVQREVTSYTVVPYGIFKYDYGYYLLAQKLPGGEDRTFGIERFTGVPEVIDYTGELPPRLDFEERFNDPFGPFNHIDEFEAVLKFSTAAGLFQMELQWPDAVKIEKQPDDSVIMRVKTRSAFGLKRWIYSFGTGASVLEPKWLREEVRQEHLKCAQMSL